jgi:hypothetical protein
MQINGRNIIYSSEGKGDYILVKDLKKFIEQKINNVPSHFNDVKGLYRASLRDAIINQLEESNAPSSH